MASTTSSVTPPKATYRGKEYIGVLGEKGAGATCRHPLFVIPIEQSDLAQMRWSPRGGRTELGEGLYFSRNPDCGWPGSARTRRVRPKLLDGAPVPLPRADYDLLKSAGHDLPEWEGRPLYVVGAATSARCTSLGLKHKQFIAEQIARLARVAGDEDDEMRQVARDLIDRLLWRWTADGYDGGRRVVRFDGRKYDFDSHPHTPAARERDEQGGKGVVHEHVVPRSVLVEHIRKSKMDAAALLAFLERFCFAALIVEDEEDDHIPKALRCEMPGTFFFEAEDPDVWGRYDQWLCSALVFPEGATCPKPRRR